MHPERFIWVLTSYFLSSGSLNFSPVMSASKKNDSHFPE